MSNYGGKKSSQSKELDEVEELLRATEDSMLLKLNVNTHHTSRSSSSSSFTTSSTPLDDDLVSRFEALKKPSVGNKITTVPSGSGEKKEGSSGDDVFARFSALRGGGGSSVEANVNQGGEVVEKEEEDEVSKLIRWAVDAARLDPSLGDDDDGSTSDTDEEDEDEDEEEEDVKKKKEKPAK